MRRWLKLWWRCICYPSYCPNCDTYDRYQYHIPHAEFMSWVCPRCD